MNKKNLIILVLVIGIIGGLLAFSCFYKFEDSHLRVEGIRVKVDDYALMVDGCSEENAAMCKKIIKVGDKNYELLFQFKNFRENGFPNTLVATLNGKEFYKDEGLNIETKSSDEYTLFMNFNVLNEEVISFTITKGVNGGTTSLYAIDLDGKIILEEHEIAEDMLIKDYDYETEFLTFKDDAITVKASRLNSYNYVGDKYICDIKPSQVVEALYTYTYSNGKFTKRLSSSVNATKFIKDNKIGCKSGE